jgi:hypothetical protein
MVQYLIGKVKSMRRLSETGCDNYAMFFTSLVHLSPMIMTEYFDSFFQNFKYFSFSKLEGFRKFCLSRKSCQVWQTDCALACGVCVWPPSRMSAEYRQEGLGTWAVVAVFERLADISHAASVWILRGKSFRTMGHFDI